MRHLTLVSMLLALLPVGCEEALFNKIDDPEPERVIEMSTFAVTTDWDQTERGHSPDKPLSAGAGTELIYVSAEALLSDDTPFSGFERQVKVVVQPGEIVPGVTATATFVNGRLDRFPINVGFAFGSTQIWVEDTLGQGASYVTGVSQNPVFFERARIRSVQWCDREIGAGCSGTNSFPSPLNTRFVRMYRHHDAGDLVITHVSNEGLFVTDTSEPESAAGAHDYEFGHLYVYNHNRPEGLERGMRLSSLAGNVTEFFGLTELGFPSWERLPCDERQEGDTWYLCRGAVDDAGLENPEDYAAGGTAAACPVGKKCCPAGQVLVDIEPPECSGAVCTIGECLPLDCPVKNCTANQVCRDNACVTNPNLVPVMPAASVEADRTGEHWEMEKLEGGLVRVERVKVLPVSGSDFDQYGQWKVQFPDESTKITVVSQGAAPDFNPKEETGTCLNLTGNLRFHVVPRWTIYPRDSRDLERTTGCP